MGFDSLLKHIDPKKGMELVKLHLSSELKVSCDRFGFLFSVKERTITVEVFDQKYEGGVKRFPYKGGEKFIDVGLFMLKEKMPPEFKGENFSIDYGKINVDGENMEGIIYFSKDGIKQQPLKHNF